MQRDFYDYSRLEKAFYSIADFVEGDFAGNALYGINYAAKVNAFYNINNLVDNILESIALYELNNAVKSIFKSSAEIFLLGQAVLCLVPVASGVFEFAVGLMGLVCSFVGEYASAALVIGEFTVKVLVALVAAGLAVANNGEGGVDVSLEIGSGAELCFAEFANILVGGGCGSGFAFCKCHNANGESEDYGQEGG